MWKSFYNGDLRNVLTYQGKLTASDVDDNMVGIRATTVTKLLANIFLFDMKLELAHNTEHQSVLGCSNMTH